MNPTEASARETPPSHERALRLAVWMSAASLDQRVTPELRRQVFAHFRSEANALGLLEPFRGARGIEVPRTGAELSLEDALRFAAGG